jgi:hypothetical protein
MITSVYVLLRAMRMLSFDGLETAQTMDPMNPYATTATGTNLVAARYNRQRLASTVKNYGH